MAATWERPPVGAAPEGADTGLPIDLAHDVTGTGPDLVLVHGLGSSRRCWDLVVPLLGEEFRVWAIDLPGHGDSPAIPAESVAPRELAAAVRGFLDAQGVEQAHAAGNSLGGFIALELGTMPGTASVTALCPAGLWQGERADLSPRLRANRRAAQALRPAIPAIMRIGPLRRALMATGVERTRALPMAIAIDAGMAQAVATGFDAALAGATAARFAGGPAIPTSVPVTIAFGDRDRLLSRATSQNRDLAPAHARWEVLWNCGHAPRWDVPGATASLILTTAATTTAASAARA